MKTYLQKIVRFIRDEEGASATEYVILVTVIALAFMVGALAFGTGLSELYNSNASQVSDSLPK